MRPSFNKCEALFSVTTISTKTTRNRAAWSRTQMKKTPTLATPAQAVRGSFLLLMVQASPLHHPRAAVGSVLWQRSRRRCLSCSASWQTCVCGWGDSFCFISSTLHPRLEMKKHTFPCCSSCVAAQGQASAHLITCKIEAPLLLTSHCSAAPPVLTAARHKGLLGCDLGLVCGLRPRRAVPVTSVACLLQ